MSLAKISQSVNQKVWRFTWKVVSAAARGVWEIKKGLTEKVKPFIDTGSINACQP